MHHRAGSCLKRGARAFVGMLAVVLSGTCIAGAPPLTLVDALGMAERSNASLQAVIARQDAARAASVTARQLPNPDIEVIAGPVRPRSIGGPDGHALAINFGQPLDYAGLRAVRARLADLGSDGAEAAVRTLRRSLYARVRVHFYQVLQRQEQLRIAEEELLALQQIRERVNLRVQLGEAPRLDLIRADTELLNARRNRDSSIVRVEQARGALASLIGMPPGELPRIEGALPSLTAVPSLVEIRDQALRSSPELGQLEAEQRRARARVELEQGLRRPQVRMLVGHDTEPDQTRWRLGLSVPLPLFNQRQGQILEAQADASFADAQFASRRQQLLGEIDYAIAGYSIARQQVDAFESGLIRQAEQTVRVAEAAYRFGERGIIDYLDAQRTLRGVRQEYINALYEARYALIEVERLVGVDVLGGIK
ncbi:MAG: TolC family protein [bacterium]|nr:TolC family protein [Betaproteobacteria bacterium]